MIRIVTDPYSVADATADSLVVTETPEYIASRLAIRDALRMHRPLDVVVRSRRIASWYGSLQDYPDVSMEIVSPTARLLAILARHGKVPSPLPLTDREVVELDLISKAQSSPPTTVLTSEDDLKSWVLSVAAGSVWQAVGGAPDHVAELATYYLACERMDFCSAVDKLRSERVETWCASSLGKLYRWLLEKPTERAFLMFVWQVCRSYSNSMRDRVLKDISTSAPKELALLSALLADLGPVMCPDDDERKLGLARRLELLWKRALKEQLKVSTVAGNSERFRTTVISAVGQMSGSIQGELEALKWFASAHAMSMSQEACELLGAKFPWAASQLEEIRSLVPPDYPPRFATDGDWATTRDWVVHLYLPYRRWMLARGRRDSGIDKMAEACSDWVYAHYPGLKNDLDPLVYGTWSRIQALACAGRQVLWVVIDNLSGLWVHETVQAFARQGFQLNAGPEWRIAMLPSETATSKSALIAGRLPNQIPESDLQKYRRLFDDACSVHDVRGRYVSEDGLRDSRLKEEQVTCWVTNRLDTESHEGFFDIEKDVAYRLERIAERVRRFIPNELSPKHFCLVVSTDHGSCHVPRGSKETRIPKGVDAAAHKRYFESLVPMQQDDHWYVLDPDRYALHRHTAVVKGYAYVGRGLPAGLVHGGLTPEEAIIPHLEFGLERVEPRPIECRHKGDPIMGTRKQRTVFSLANYNDAEAANVLIGFPTHGLQLTAASIPAKDEIEATGEVRITKEDLARTRAGDILLRGLISYRCRGEVVRGPTTVRIRIRRIMEGPSEAEQLLGM